MITPSSGPPDETALREAALSYLARYTATESGLIAVLDRKIERWARGARERDNLVEQMATAKAIARTVVAHLVAAGAVSDTVFAENRARSLVRAGRSRRAVTATLAAKGVDVDLARAAAPDDAETELGAALVLARKRRIGPFRTREPNRIREFGILARNGFPRAVVEQALDMDLAEAETRIQQLRQS